MWKGRRVSVVLIAFNFEEAVYDCIRDFSLPEVDEIVVTDNNSTDRTVEEIERAAREDPRVRLVRIGSQGYGHSYRGGLSAATGDLIIAAPANRTFVGTDLYKLLLYGEEFDGVFGTRTSRSMIWEGANMGLFLKYGNWAVAKYLELLLGRPSLTDVGCTMRLIRRDLLERIRDRLVVGGSHFSPEMMFHMIREGSTVEIPLHFRPRVGRPGITSDRRVAFWIGLRMIARITSLWVRYVVGDRLRLR